MSDIDDGVIKYDRSFFTQGDPLPPQEYIHLEKWREILYDLNLIGEYLPEKIGYGNLSQRKNYTSFLAHQEIQFLITGTQTGGLAELQGEHYTRVVGVEIKNLKVIVNGPREASSEALTHAAIYQANSQIQAVFHIHHLSLWKFMIKSGYPSTKEHIPYGTLEMAKATIDLVGKTTQGIFSMQGHREGIISYGRSLKEAGEIILELFQKIK